MYLVFVQFGKVETIRLCVFQWSGGGKSFNELINLIKSWEQLIKLPANWKKLVFILIAKNIQYWVVVVFVKSMGRNSGGYIWNNINERKFFGRMPTTQVLLINCLPLRFVVDSLQCLMCLKTHKNLLSPHLKMQWSVRKYLNKKPYQDK